MASRDIRADRPEDAWERWGSVYPGLVSLNEPTVGRDLWASRFYALNLMEAGQEQAAQQVLDKCLALALQLKGDSLGLEDWIYSTQKNREKVLAENRKLVVDLHQRAELDFSGPELDFIRDDPEFQELMKIFEDDLAQQRQRIRQMERNGELSPTPGIDLSQL